MKRWFGWILLVLSTGIAGINVYNLTVLAKQEGKSAPSQPSTPRSISSASLVEPPANFTLLTELPLDRQIAQRLHLSQSDASQSHRHRYVLATLYLAQNKPESALTALTDLEESYPLLTEYIWLKRSEAYTRLGKLTQATALQNDIRNRYPNAAVAAEVAYAQKDFSALLGRYPSHPLALEVLRQSLQRQPQRQDLLTLLATYYPDTEKIGPFLDRLTQAPKLSPELWWAIGDGYFDNFAYEKASRAYAKATPNPITTYRLGRSYHRADQRSAAIQAYRQVILLYPQSPEAPRALLRLMTLVSAQEALQIADRLVDRYPDTAAEALLEKYYLQRDVLKVSPEATRKALLQGFPQSSAAAQLLLSTARSEAKSGKLQEAISTVRTLLVQHKSSEIAAEAGFWAGKWADRIGDRSGAQQFYQQVLREHPSSYYAWRSASSLGWPVGNPNGVRQINHTLAAPAHRDPLPTGSPVLQELFLLGQDQDAQRLWQFTMRGKRVLNVREIFTDGIMRVLAGDYLLGIRQLDSLTWLDVSPAEEAQILELLPHSQRYPFLYPLAYQSIVQPQAQSKQLSPALVFGLIRQESRFEARIRSSADALGLMQIIPETADWVAGKVGKKNYDLRNPSDNVEFGTWYLDYTHSRYNNNSMLAIASYNAGPGAVAKWVRGGIGDPDEFMEKIPYAETRDYVKKVFANYWNYLRLYAPAIKQQLAQNPS